MESSSESMGLYIPWNAELIVQSIFIGLYSRRRVATGNISEDIKVHGWGAEPENLLIETLISFLLCRDGIDRFTKSKTMTLLIGSADRVVSEKGLILEMVSSLEGGL